MKCHSFFSSHVFFTVDYLYTILFCIVYYIYTRKNTNGQLGEICPGIKTILHASILVWDCNYSNYACKCFLSFVIRFCREYFVHRKNVTIDGKGLQNKRVLAHFLFSSMKESLYRLCHTWCVTGGHAFCGFTRWIVQIKSTFTTSLRYWGPNLTRTIFEFDEPRKHEVACYIRCDTRSIGSISAHKS